MSTPPQDGQREFLSAEKARMPCFVGVDLGGTNVKVGLVDDRGRPMSYLSVPTSSEKGPEDTTSRMGAAVKKAIRQAGLQPEQVARVGLGSPGTMDLAAGKLLKPVNLKGWDDFPIRDRLAEACGLPVAFANDAGAAAYGEFWVGSGKSFGSLVLLTLGTGIGCGIIIGDQSIDGQHSHGAECGHILIDPSNEARWCNCGRQGHLEAYASATAVIRRTRELLECGLSSSLSDRLAEGNELTPKLVGQEAEAGDALSVKLVLDTGTYLAWGIVTLIHTIDPSGVLLGGAMTFGGNRSKLGRRFLSHIQREVKARVFETLVDKVKVNFASLGGDAGYIGAAGIARVETIQARRNAG